MPGAPEDDWDGNWWPYHEQEREGGAGFEEVRLKAIPYYAWSNRGTSYVRVSAHRRRIDEAPVAPRRPNQPRADGRATPSGDRAVKLLDGNVVAWDHEGGALTTPGCVTIVCKEKVFRGH